jgi:hypothetical protein
MKAWSRFVLSAFFLILCAGPAAAGTLKLEIRGGLVTLEARDVLIRDILAEWARVGQTRIENREQVGGGLVTLTLRDVPEREALDILLRSVTGYIAAPRATPVADGSVYEVIYVLAAARPANRMVTAPVQNQSQPFRTGPGQAAPGIATRPVQPPDDLSDDDPLPALQPGFTGAQMPFPGAAGSGQIPGLLSPGPIVAPTMATSGTGDVTPAFASPGIGSTQNSTTPGTVAPGAQSAVASKPGAATPYVPGGGATQPTTIPKPPDATATTPPGTVIKPPGAPE